MTITKRQFTQLQAMGIELWQLKNTTTEVTTSDFLEIDFSAVIKTNIFTDIINSLDISIGEVNYENRSLSLGLLTWQFSEKDEISLTKTHLITPEINVLINSPLLKKSLWQKLQEHSLT
jgi:DNA polymerase III psi subunit